MIRLCASRLPFQAMLGIPRVATFSTSSDLVFTSLNEETGVASLVMNRLPVNSLSLEM